MKNYPITSKGVFWFPENEEKKYYGYLNFDYANGITIEIFDDENLIRRQVSYINIFGVLEDKKKITLNKCSFIGAGNFLNEFPTTKFSIMFLLVGKHFNNIPIHFDSCIIDYSNLNSFISINSLVNLNDKNDTISYKRELNVSSYCKIKFYSENNKSNGKLLVMIKSLKSKTLDYYIELVNIIQDFLNLVISDNVFVMSIIGIHGQYEKIEIIYNSQRSAENNNSMMFKPHVTTLLFRYEQVAHTFENILAKWFELSEQLKNIYNLYFGVIYNTQLYDVTMFLMLAEALENYHLKVKDNNSLYKITKKNYIKKLKILVNESTFSNLDKQYLIKGLSNISSLSREERYEELYCYYRKILIKILSIKDKERFLSLVIKTRNYYTHYKENPHLIAKDYELIFIIKDLQCFLQLCFLSQMNFSLKEIEIFYKIDKL